MMTLKEPEARAEVPVVSVSRKGEPVPEPHAAPAQVPEKGGVPLAAVPMLLLFLGFLVAAGRAVTIYLEHPREEAVRRSTLQVSKQQPLLGRRGSIYDRNGWELALSERMYTLTVSGRHLQQRLRVRRNLAYKDRPEVVISNVLGRPLQDVRERLDPAIREGAPYRIIAKNVEPKQARLLMRELRRRHWLDFALEPTQSRRYPMGAVGASVVGFVDRRSVAPVGIERVFDGVLSGTDGYRSFIKTPFLKNGAYVPDQNGTPARDGDHVRLCLDATISWFANEELRHTCEKAKARWGAAVVLDPSDGRILALESWPTFDPERFHEYARAEDSPFKNRGVQSLFTPGSIFKPFVMAAALEQGKLRLSESFECGPGVHRFEGRRLRDHKPLHTLTATEVLTRSSNIGMAFIGRRLDDQVLYEYFRSFGLYDLTGIEATSEVATQCAPLPWDKTYDTVSLSFGHAIALTPLRVATSFCAFANGGYRVEPRLVESYLDNDGNEVTTPARKPVRVLEQHTAVTMKDLLRKVVTEGTGKRLEKMAPELQIAGKSGTTQKERLRNGKTVYTASFIGFAPCDDPRLLTLVVVDEPQGLHSGSGVAGPAVASILQKASEHLSSSAQEDDSDKQPAPRQNHGTEGN